VAQVSRQKFASVPPISFAERCPLITEIENKIVVRNAANTARTLVRHPYNFKGGNVIHRSSSYVSSGLHLMDADLTAPDGQPNGLTFCKYLIMRKVDGLTGKTSPGAYSRNGELPRSHPDR